MKEYYFLFSFSYYIFFLFQYNITAPFPVKCLFSILKPQPTRIEIILVSFPHQYDSFTVSYVLFINLQFTLIHNDEAKLITRPFSNYNDRFIAIYCEYFNITNKKYLQICTNKCGIWCVCIHIILQRDVVKLRH